MQNEPDHNAEHQSYSNTNAFMPAPADLINVGRRNWCLRTGLSAIAGLTLPQLMRVNSAIAGQQKSPKSVILIWLSGGPSQLDIWDMKPTAPLEVRGPFNPIPTNVPGIDICEHLPKMANMMDQFALLRSVDASASNHTPITFQAANPNARRTNDGKDGAGYPSLGALAAKFRGANQPGMPAYVALADSLKADVYGAGHLGNAYEPLDGMQIQGKFGLPNGIQIDRLKNRDALRQQFDRFKSEVDASSALAMQDRYVQEAYNMVLSGRAQKAFDLSQEPAEVRERYGKHSFGQKSLLARRLVEAGVSFITMSDAWGHWDHHGDQVRWGGIEKGLKPMLPVLDQGATNLIGDLGQRGLLDQTLVLILGEFGRTPKINSNNGRDHWVPVMSLLMAGGGIKTGQVIGSTERNGGAIKDRPVLPGDLAATILQHLEIDPQGHWMTPRGRPTPFVERGAPITELI